MLLPSHMVDRRIWFVGLLGNLLVVLACGGVGTEGSVEPRTVGDQQPEGNEANTPASPSVKPIERRPLDGDEARSRQPQLDSTKDGSGAAKNGLAEVLGFPVVGGEVRKNEDKAVDVLHVSAFDPGELWESYSTKLVLDGWRYDAGAVPPFRGVFHKDNQTMELEATLAGSSVWIRARLK